MWYTAMGAIVVKLLDWTCANLFTIAFHHQYPNPRGHTGLMGRGAEFRCALALRLEAGTEYSRVDLAFQAIPEEYKAVAVQAQA